MEGRKQLVIVQLGEKEYIGELEGDLLQILGVNREHTPGHLAPLSYVSIPGCPVTCVPYSRLFSNEFCLTSAPTFDVPRPSLRRFTCTLLVLSHINFKAAMGRSESFPLLQPSGTSPLLER